MMLSPNASASILKPAVVSYRDSPYNSPSLNRRVFSGVGMIREPGHLIVGNNNNNNNMDDDDDETSSRHLENKSRVIGELTSLIKSQFPADSCCGRSRPVTRNPISATSKTLKNLQAPVTSYSAPSSPSLKKAQLSARLSDARNGSSSADAGATLTSKATIKISNPNLSSSRTQSPCDTEPRSLKSTTSLNVSSGGFNANGHVKDEEPYNMLKKSGVTGITATAVKKTNQPTRDHRSISADPRLHDLSIQERIGNRSTKTVEKSIGKCGTCKKPVTSEGCTAFGNVYHKECFKCCICKKRIDGKFFEKNGKPYCSKDYEKVVEECYVCKLPIKGDCVESNKLCYHPECMKCFVCGEQLRGTYFTYKNQPICERDYKQRAERCCVCNEVLTGKYYSSNNETYCEKHYEEHGDKCPRCNEDVSGKHVKISGAVFHPECFSCVVCGKNMLSDSFFSDSNHRVYCQEDYAKKRAYKCSYCKKPILPKEGQSTAPRIRALEKDFHPECFKCEDCGLLLDSKVKGKECYPWKNHVLCLKCNRKKLSSDESDDDDDDDDPGNQE